MTEKYVLSANYQGGQSEVISDHPKAANLQAGLAVSLSAAGVPQVVGSGVLFGISGSSAYIVNTPVVRSGLKVCVQLDGTAPAIGTAVSFTEAGKVSTSGTITSAATVASEAVTGIDPADNSEVTAILIDFPNGL